MEEEELGNGLKNINTYNTQTGFLSNTQTKNIANQNTLIQLGYSFNDIGNLTQRTDALNGYAENFGYDALNRLTSAAVVGKYTVNLTYNAIGNITFKSDVGHYTYGENGAGPHAVTSIDNSGMPDCVEGFTGTVAYTSFKKAHTLEEGDHKATIAYNPNRRRTLQQSFVQDSLTSKKRYFGKLYEWKQDTAVHETHYLFAGDKAIGFYKTTNGANAETRYLHQDHLGSIQAISDGQGNILETFSYDAWGKRRNTDWSQPANNLIGSLDRGFTGHEHLDLFNLINMNGRIYDPVIGRFLSADPFVQDVLDLQNLNRYTYVLNNPLSLTDPSGFFFKKLFKSIKNLFTNKIKSFVQHAVGLVTAAIANIIAAPLIAIPGIGQYIGSIVSSAGYGFGYALAGTLLNGGSIGDAFEAGLKSAVIYGVRAAITGGLGGGFGGAASDLLTSGTESGLNAVFNGGKFEHGFIDGALSSINQDNNSSSSLGFIISVVVSGTRSKLGGGKFSNGAITGTYTYMYKEFWSVVNDFKRGPNILSDDENWHSGRNRFNQLPSGVLNQIGNTKNYADEAGNEWEKLSWHKNLL